jgi:hypothetical protein
MQEASESFMGHVTMLLSQAGDFSDQLLDLRKLLEASNITNKVVDGTIPFPENQQSIRDGISLEFRYFVCRLRLLQSVNMNEILRDVSFKYPGSEKYALRGISFRVERGQLCVIISHYTLRGHKVNSHPLNIAGHPWFERIREKHDSQAYGSII